MRGLQMIKYQDIAHNHSEFLSMTGYTLEEFNALIPWFEESLAESAYTLEGKERKNNIANYVN